MKRWWRYTFLISLAMVLFGLDVSTDYAGGGAEAKAILWGYVTTGEQVVLPPGAEILVVLEDVSLMDAAAKPVAAKRFRAVGRPPYAFALDYDPAAVGEAGRYSVRARVEWDGRLRFVSTALVDPFSTPGGGPVQVPVTRVTGW